MVVITNILISYWAECCLNVYVCLGPRTGDQRNRHLEDRFVDVLITPETVAK